MLLRYESPFRDETFVALVALGGNHWTSDSHTAQPDIGALTHPSEALAFELLPYVGPSSCLGDGPTGLGWTLTRAQLSGMPRAPVSSSHPEIGGPPPMVARRHPAAGS
jgi:hypothetical protein